MKLLAAPVMLLSLFATACANLHQATVAPGSYAHFVDSDEQVQKLIVTPRGSRPSRQAPPEYFTGSARIEPLFDMKDPSNTSGSYVTFEPGARSAWHTHPAGQILIVTAGMGRVQRWGDPVEEIGPGDVVLIPPGQKHWHGASLTTAMTHVAIQTAVGGKNVDWMEKVSEEEYKMAPTQESNALPRMLTPDDVRMVAPALERYTDSVLVDLWNRPDLSARDRSLVTVAVLIARNQSAELTSHLERALDNGVKAGPR